MRSKKSTNSSVAAISDRHRTNGVPPFKYISINGGTPFVLILTILLIFSSLSAERLSFAIEYLNFTVATLDIEKTDSTISVQSSSSKFISLFTSSYENYYTTEIDSLFLPIIYKKSINQKNFQEEAIITYYHDIFTANYKDSITNMERNYNILEDSREFFSALYYLRTLNLKEDNNLTLDVAGKIVLLSTKYIESETIKTNIGRRNTNKIELYFKWYDNTQKMRSDILTNNIWLEDNTLTFWFTDDEKQIPVKAQYNMKPFSVFWNLKSASKP